MVTFIENNVISNFQCIKNVLKTLVNGTFFYREKFYMQKNKNTIKLIRVLRVVFLLRLS